MKYQRCRGAFWVISSRCVQFHLNEAAGGRTRNAPVQLNLSDSLSWSPLRWTWVGASIRCRLCPGESFIWAEPNSKRPVARLLFYLVSQWWVAFRACCLFSVSSVQFKHRVVKEKSACFIMLCKLKRKIVVSMAHDSSLWCICNHKLSATVV